MRSTLARSVYIRTGLTQSVRGGKVGFERTEPSGASLAAPLPQQSRDRSADTSTVAGGSSTEAVISSASGRQIPTLAVNIKMSRRWH